MFRLLVGWMDRDWASRQYNPVFAFTQRLVWGVPVLVSIAAVGLLDALGYARDSEATLVTVGLGIVGSFALMMLSSYRWAKGYTRSDFQEQAAIERQSRLASRQGIFRRLFKRASS